MGQTIDIREYLDLIRKRKKIIIFIIILFMLCGRALQYLHDKSYVPTYTSRVSVKININKNTQKDSSKKEPYEDAEAKDNGAKDTEAKDNGAKDTEARYTGVRYTEPTEAEATDTEATDTEATDTEATDTEVTDTEVTDTEATDTEATDTEATDIEATDTEPTEAEATDTETRDTKTTDTEAEPVETTADIYSSSLQSSAINQDIGSKYSSLATSKRAMLDLKDRLDLQLNPEAISSSITVTPGADLTEFIDISVTNTDAKLAKKIAEQMPDVFNSELMRVIGIDCVETLFDASEAMQNPKPADNTFRNFTLAGIVLAIFVVLLLECLDNKVVTPDDVEKYWGLPVIGVVPFEKENTKEKRIKAGA